MKLSNRVYDVLKWIALYLLPRRWARCISRWPGIWEFRYGEEIVGTITALDTFLGVLLGISTAQYNRRKRKRIKTDRDRSPCRERSHSQLYFHGHIPHSRRD